MSSQNEGDKKAAPITETPEFAAAVSKAVSDLLPEAVRHAVAQVQAEITAKAMNRVASSGGDEGLVERLAMAIAEISDQGTNRKRVAPEVLAQRAEAHKRMVARIERARDRGEQPEYALVSKVYLSEQFIEPFMPGPNKQVVRTEIIWTGVPNEAMRPLNQPAKEIYNLFRDSIGSTEKVKGEDTRGLWLTQGGVVIKGNGAAQKREVNAEIESEDRLGFKDPHDPRAEHVNVLGTIAKPARQNVSTEHAVLR